MFVRQKLARQKAEVLNFADKNFAVSTKIGLISKNPTPQNK
jgi:hypothetical protein